MDLKIQVLYDYHPEYAYVFPNKDYAIFVRSNHVLFYLLLFFFFRFFLHVKSKSDLHGLYLLPFEVIDFKFK